MRYLKQRYDKIKRRRYEPDHIDHKKNSSKRKRAKIHSEHRINSLRSWLHNQYREEDNN